MPDWVVTPLSAPADLDAVLAIEEASFTNPWTREMYIADLENHGVSYCYVAREGLGPIVGFCSFWLVVDELHLNNLAVDQAHRRAGVATALMATVQREGARLGGRLVRLEVRRSNVAAQHLYAALGFTVAGVRRGYYTKPVEDALVLVKNDLGA